MFSNPKIIGVLSCSFLMCLSLSGNAASVEAKT